MLFSLYLNFKKLIRDGLIIQKKKNCVREFALTLGFS